MFFIKNTIYMEMFLCNTPDLNVNSFVTLCGGIRHKSVYIASYLCTKPIRV